MSVASPLVMPLPFRPHTVAASRLLDVLPQPMLVITPDRRLVFANARAHGLMLDEAIRIRDGRLAQLGQLDTPRLQEQLLLTSAGSSTRTGLWFGPHLSTGWLHAMPLPTEWREDANWPDAALLLLVHLDQPALTQPARIDALTRQCRLSQAERHVLMLLADGDTVEDVAERLGLCVSTVRSHVRNLLGKTQARSLMQLLRWTGSAGALPH